MPPGRGSAVGRKVLAPLYAQCLRLSERFFIQSVKPSVVVNVVFYTAVLQTANDSGTPNAVQTFIKAGNTEHVPSRELRQQWFIGE